MAANRKRTPPPANLAAFEAAAAPWANAAPRAATASPSTAAPRVARSRATAAPQATAAYLTLAAPLAEAVAAHAGRVGAAELARLRDTVAPLASWPVPAVAEHAAALADLLGRMARLAP